MNHLFKKFLAALLAVVLMCNMLPLSIFAEGIAETIPDAPTGDSKDIGEAAPIFRFDGYKTLDDFGIWESAGFSLRSTKASSSYLNPQTIRPTSQLYGYQWIYSENASHYPFTASFTLDADYMPQNSVYIAIANYDCDEFGNSNSREYDQVYINGHCVGVLTGNDGTSNTTLLKVDRSYLQPGLNEIVIRVGIEVREKGAYRWNDTPGAIYADDPYDQWVLRVDDIQLLCDGGSTEGRPDVFRVNLTRAELLGNQLNCYVTTYVEDSQDRTFTLEYALYDWSCEESSTYGQIIDDDFATIRKDNYQYEGSLTMPADSYSGTYAAVVYLKVRENGIDTILAYDEEQFEYETGIVPSFDIQNLTATPATLEWTSGAVDILLSADIDVEAGLTDLVFYLSEDVQVPATVDENGHVTGVLPLTENGFYTIALCYNKDGKSYRRAVSVEINNIVQAPDDSQQQIFKAGWFTNNTHLVGSTCGYTGSHTFWTTTSAQTDAVDVLVNGKVLGTLGADSIVEQDEATRLYRVKLKLVEGLKTITFRTGDGTDQETIYFGAINPISEQTMYAIGKTVALRTWPSLDAAAATYISLDTPVEVRGEIDIRQGEGFYYALYNGKNYFIDKRDLADTTLEKQFREYVKTVSSLYYGENGSGSKYDLNKYYYFASEVKYSWDDHWTRRDDAYSTQDTNSQYNIQSVQQMLVDGVQQKATAVTQSFRMDNYMEGMGFNPLKGRWEVNNKAVMTQAMYNQETGTAIETAMNEWGMAGINAIVDAMVIKATGGNMTEDAADLIELCTTVLTDVMNIYTQIRHEQEMTVLQNMYRGMMKQSIVDMYQNIDQQISEEYRSLQKTLQNKSKRSSEEQLLLDQLNLLIAALDKQEDQWVKNPPADVQRIYEEAADELVNAIGLELREEMTHKEIAKRVIVEVASSIVLNVLELFADKWLEDKIDNDVLSLVVGYFKTTLFDLVDQAIDDWNTDGALTVEELVNATLGALHLFLNDDHIEDLCEAFYDAAYKNEIVIGSNTMKKLKERMADLKDKLNTALDKYAQSPKKIEAINHKTTAEAAYNDQYEGYDISKKQYDEVLEKTQEKVDNMGTLGIMVEDVISITLTTLNAAKESVGIGDMADNEVQYAYYANYMTHVMESAALRRSALNQESYARNLKNHAYIDKAPVSVLREFVNKVYTVYNYDLMGHAQYLSFALGWDYVESGKKAEDWDAERQRLEYKLVMSDYNIIEGLYVTPTLLIMDLTVLLGKNSQSEYLKELNTKQAALSKTGKWTDKFGTTYTFTNQKGILSVAASETIYDSIGAYVNATHSPEKFNALN